MTARMLALTALVAGAGCGYRPPPVPVTGTAPAIAKLVGDWEGEYESGESGRSGYIAFSLAEERDTARGDVLMLAPGEPEPRWSSPEAGRIQTIGSRPTTSRVLTIHFVRAEGGTVSGSLEPYTDPGCGCTLDTQFIGRMEGDSIRGTFTSRHIQAGHTDHGTWVVRRKRPGI